MDHTPPITVSNIPLGWSQIGSFIVQLTATDYADTIFDTPSGVAVTYYTTDGTEPNFSSPNHVNPNPLLPSITQFTITGQGIYTIKYFSVDNNGNTEFTKTNYLNLDNEKPQSTATPNFAPDGLHSWYLTNPLISLSAIDTASGVLKIFYSWNGAPFQEYLGVPFSIPSEGIHSLQFYSVDTAGNTEDINTTYFQYDQIAPVTQDDAPSGLQHNPVTVHFFTSDNASGPFNTFYTTDGSTPTTSSPSGTSFVLSATGTYTIKYFSLDYAGNQESVKQSAVNVVIDTQAPHVSIYESFPINGNDGWYRSTPNISLAATDPSGVLGIFYQRYPQGATTTAKYTSPNNLSATIDLSVNYHVKLQIDQAIIGTEIDMRGVIPGQTTIAEIISKINTALTVTVASETNAQGGTGTGYITLTSPTAGLGNPYSLVKFLQPSGLDATFAVFALSQVSYPHTYSELVAYRQYTSSFQLLNDGYWQVDYYAIDGQNNKGAPLSKIYKLDSQNPATTTVVSYLPDGTNNWYKTNPDIVFNRSDNLSGIYKTYFQWDNGIISEYISGTTVTNIPSQGIHSLHFYSIDNAGNIEALNTQIFKYDYTVPVTYDDTLDLQGIVFTARSRDVEQVLAEVPTLLASTTDSSVIVSVVKTQQVNVTTVMRLDLAITGFGTTPFHVYQITGINRDELKCLPLVLNATATRLGSYQISLPYSGSGNVLRSFSDVLSIYNTTTNTHYAINPALSSLVTGILTVSGDHPIDIGDVVKVDFATPIPPGGLQPSPIPVGLAANIEIDYQFDDSHEVEVLNTLDYTIVVPQFIPKIHDHNVTVTLDGTDNTSGVVQTFYTTDGSDPKTSLTVQFGTTILLDQDGAYTIRYYSVDGAGNAESTKTAQYQIVIDKEIPTLAMSIVPDINDQGRNSWYQKSFGLLVDITTDDIVPRYNETALQVTDFRIFTSENDKLDFEETPGVPLFANVPSIEITTSNNNIDFEETPSTQLDIMIPVGVYTGESLALEIQNQLNSVGASTYTVVYSAKKYTITSNLVGGSGIFNILWATGTHSNFSPVRILGFNKINKTGNAFYLSDNEINTSYLYSTANLCIALQNALQAASGAASNYTVTTVGGHPFSVGYRFNIQSDVSGGAGIFTILWYSGIHDIQTIGKTLGYETTLDNYGAADYTSDYFKVKLANYFVQSVSLVRNNITHQELQIRGVDRGASGFYDEIIIGVRVPSFFVSPDGIEPGIFNIQGVLTESPFGSDIPLDYELLKVDYKHHPGIDYVAFGLDTPTLSFSFNVYNDLDKFVGLSKAQYTSPINLSASIDLSVNYNIKLELNESTIGIEIDLRGFNPAATTLSEIISNINTALDYPYAYETNIKGESGTGYITLANFASEVKFVQPSANDATLAVFGLSQLAYPHTFSNLAVFRILFPPIPGQFFLQDGIHTLYGKSFDHNSVGGTGVPQKVSNLVTLNFKLDRVSPTTTDDVINLGWRQGSAVITLTPTDPTPGSGIDKTHFSYSLNPLDVPTELSPYIQNLPNQKIVISTSGSYTLKYFSVDFAGNLEVVKTCPYLIQVDANAPITTLLTSPALPDGTNSWFVTDPVITLSAVDPDSGVANTFYKLPGQTSFTLYTGPFLLVPQGAIVVQYYSVDNVGNIETLKSTTVKFDNTPPVTTTNIPLVGYSNDPTVVFTINDPASGGFITHFTIDGTNPTISSPSGSSVTFNASGTYTIKFFSIDNAGNIEVFQTQTLNLDLELPYVTNFLPPGGIVTDLTTEISFHLQDDLSGVDIAETIFEVDGIEYSQTKNSSYFNYSGTPADYFVQIYPIQGVLNFENIGYILLKNVKDFAGNTASVLEFDFRPADTTPPRIREVYPLPNAKDVSTTSNVIAYISDNQSGVNLESVKITINDTIFQVVVNEVLKIQYVGPSTQAFLTIQNNTLRTDVNGQQDIAISLVDVNYSTIRKLNDYIDSLPNYTCSIIDLSLQHKESKLILDISNSDLTVDPILKIFDPLNNLNFAFIERENGYLIFATPNFSFADLFPVLVKIEASDNIGNVMPVFSYSFTPSIIAVLSVGKRNYLNRTALTFIDDIHKNIASNYTRSRSTHFYGHHKSVSKEWSRVQEELDHLFEDESFLTVRSRFLYEKFGYLLKTPPVVGFSHEDYRRLLLSLLQIFFKGSLKSSIEEGVSLFIGDPIQITETVFTEGADISEQFTFSADIIIGQSRLLGLDLQLISDQLDNLFKIVKPAHTFVLKRFIFADQFDFQAGCTLEWLKNIYDEYVLDMFGHKIPIIGPSGFQVATKNAPTAICDRQKYELDYYINEDARTDCEAIQTVINEIVEDVSVQFTGVEDSFHTFYVPLLKNIVPPEVADILDVVVTVNNVPVVITDVDPLTGIITLAVTPTALDVVVAYYFYNPNFVYREVSMYLNGGNVYQDFNIIGNDFDPTVGSIFNTFNVHDVLGGFVIDTRLHAHVCETHLTFQIEDEEGDTYVIPDCNNRSFFYLNTYTVSGNDFDLSDGSYFNTLDIVGYSPACPYLLLEIQDAHSEELETPTSDTQQSIELEGQFTSEAELADVVEQLSSITLDNYQDNAHAVLRSCGFFLNDSESLLNRREDHLAPPASCDFENITIEDTQQELIEVPTSTDSSQIENTDEESVRFRTSIFYLALGTEPEGILNDPQFTLLSLVYKDNLSVIQMNFEEVSGYFTLNDAGSTLNGFEQNDKIFQGYNEIGKRIVENCSTEFNFSEVFDDVIEDPSFQFNHNELIETPVESLNEQLTNTNGDSVELVTESVSAYYMTEAFLISPTTGAGLLNTHGELNEGASIPIIF